MLPPFHIRNLQPSSLPKAFRDTLVQINAPCYDETISSHPAATLKYLDDDDGDLITVGAFLSESLYLFCADANVQLGSSRELTEKLEESYLPSSSGSSADLQLGLQSSEHHVFEINDRDDVRKLWQDVQKSFTKDSDAVSVWQGRDDAMNWSAEEKNTLAIFYER